MYRRPGSESADNFDIHFTASVLFLQATRINSAHLYVYVSSFLSDVVLKFVQTCFSEQPTIPLSVSMHAMWCHHPSQWITSISRLLVATAEREAIAHPPGTLTASPWTDR